MDYYYNHWRILVEKPRISLSEFSGNLQFHREFEKAAIHEKKIGMAKVGGKVCLIRSSAMKDLTTEDLLENLYLYRLKILIYELNEAGFLTNKATKISHGEELYKAYHDFIEWFESREYRAIFEKNTSYSLKEQLAIGEELDNAFEKVQGYINPSEVVKQMYATETGKSFLPKTLIGYIENVKNISRDILGVGKKKKKTSNHSGSKINPVRHLQTKQACQNAWNKIQKEKILNLNSNTFHELATSFLKPGQSLITTVSREFYSKQVTREYKAGSGRKPK